MLRRYRNIKYSYKINMKIYKVIILFILITTCSPAISDVIFTINETLFPSTISNFLPLHVEAQFTPSKSWYYYVNDHTFCANGMIDNSSSFVHFLSTDIPPKDSDHHGFDFEINRCAAKNGVITIILEIDTNGSKRFLKHNITVQGRHSPPSILINNKKYSCNSAIKHQRAPLNATLLLEGYYPKPDIRLRSGSYLGDVINTAWSPDTCLYSCTNDTLVVNTSLALVYDLPDRTCVITFSDYYEEEEHYYQEEEHYYQEEEQHSHKFYVIVIIILTILLIINISITLILARRNRSIKTKSKSKDVNGYISSQKGEEIGYSVREKTFETKSLITIPIPIIRTKIEL